MGLSNLAGFDPTRDALPNDRLDEMDRWMLERTADLVKKCREWYAGYDFHRVYHAIHDFCVVDLSSFYYDVLKDRLYTKAAKNKSRRSAQTAVWKITGALVRLIAPILGLYRRGNLEVPAEDFGRARKRAYGFVQRGARTSRGDCVQTGGACGSCFRRCAGKC